MAQSVIVFNVMRYSLHDGPGIRTTIFLKGCPLACAWCHNPESRDFRPTLMYFAERCLFCGDCAARCPHGAVEVANEGPRTFAAACEHCGLCVEACLAGARQLAGRRMTVAEVIEEIERDSVFFEESGGGVTLSGGEPLSQPKFAEALLAAFRERRIHTTLDTCGWAPTETLLRVSRQADLVLYDLKVMGSAAHESWTGVPNDAILANLEALAATGRPVIVRVPVVSGVNDTEGELRDLAAFVSRLGLLRIDLLPFHRTGLEKYRRIGAVSRMEAMEPAEPSHVSRIASELESRGFTVRVGG